MCCLPLPTGFLPHAEVSATAFLSTAYRPSLLLARSRGRVMEAGRGLGPRLSVWAPAHHLWPTAACSVLIKPRGPPNSITGLCLSPAPSGLTGERLHRQALWLRTGGWDRSALGSGPERKQKKGRQGSGGTWSGRQGRNWEM